MKRIISLIAFILMLTVAELSAQTVIKGNVMDTSGEPLFNVSVLVHNAGSNLIIAYGFSDIDGNYEISFNSPSDSLDIKTNSSFYEKITKRIANTSQTIDFVLKEEVYELKGVTVMARPIEKTNDTVEYFVDSFVGLEDKSIEDTTRKVLSDKAPVLTEKQQNVIDYLINHSKATLQEVAGKCSLSIGGAKKIAGQLQAAGILERVGAKNNSTWIVKGKP